MYSNLLGQSNPLSQYLRCSNQKDWPSSPINQDTVEVVNEHLPGEMSKHDQQDIFCKKEWYFVTKIVLTYCENKCSSIREKLEKLEAGGREFAKFLRLIK